jgi:hypothetical protein
MTRVWQLSKESMKEMDLLSTITDALDAFDRPSSIEKNELQNRIDRAYNLLQRLEIATKAQTSREKQKDFFLLQIAEALEKGNRLNPSDFQKEILVALEDLKRRDPEVSGETRKVLSQVLDTVMRMTSRSMEALSTTLP